MVCVEPFLKFGGGMCSAKGIGPVDRQGLEEMLRRLDAVDLDSVSRVSDSKVRQAFLPGWMQLAPPHHFRLLIGVRKS